MSLAHPLYSIGADTRSIARSILWLNDTMDQSFEIIELFSRAVSRKRNESNLQKLSHRQGLALMFVTCVILLSGCAALEFKQRDPVTVGQVIQMTERGTPAETIVQIMRDSGTVYALSAAQLAELHDLGVADPVLDYMQQTYITAERRQQSRVDWDTGYLWGPAFE